MKIEDCEGIVFFLDIAIRSMCRGCQSTEGASKTPVAGLEEAVPVHSLET